MAAHTSHESPPAFQRPIVIVCAPRSGSTMLFELVRLMEPLWSRAHEDHGVIEGVPGLHPRDRDWTSNRLVAEDLSDAIVDQLRQRFARDLQDRRGEPMSEADRQRPIRLLDKVPKNSLRIPALRRVFPDAMFIYLYRDPAESVASLIDGWLSGRFVTYPRLPDWRGLPWSFLLAPGWQGLQGAPLEDVAAHQWIAANDHIISDLAMLPNDQWIAFDYRSLVDGPRGIAERVCEFAGCTWTSELARALDRPLPLSRFTLTPPTPHKWRRHQSAIERIRGRVEVTERRYVTLVERRAIAGTPSTSQIK